MEQFKNWVEIGAGIATIVGAAGIIFLFIQHYYNKDIRNLQLMHRCIDNFRQWSEKSMPVINFFYLELLNEELFYFQKDLIQKKVCIEWIEGMMDYIQFYANDGTILTQYNDQQNIETLAIWKDKQGFFSRIHFFLHPEIDKSYIIPGFNEGPHSSKKRKLAIELYKHIKKYKY